MTPIIEPDDDAPVGRFLSRREVPGLLAGLGGVTLLAASDPGQTGTAQPTSAAMPNCMVKPELTEGPYFVDVALDRSDVRSDTSTGTMSEGVPLSLAFVVLQVGSNACTPLKGAQVDIWHCDAAGVYSGVQGSAGTNFLRGYQVTDATGRANFTSVYPGWYSGRAVHIHF
ncbi:MAG TPA: twin-arginine translocation pathway signal protein, partial [Chloroflexia bacterium]|nr:twin-arginine translocation pathway signal protein [Chloroflexia bacterium]